MPNWCGNEILIKGDRESLLEFLEKLKGKRAVYNREPALEDSEKQIKYCFNALLPVPQDVLAVGYDGQYRFRELREILKKHGLSMPDLGYSTCDESKKERLQEIATLVQKIKGEDCKKAEKLLSSIISTSDGYHWHITVDEDFVRDCEVGADVEVLMGMYSAWSPPLAFFGNISPMFPKLSFCITYGEEGCGFSGIFEIKDGEIIQDVSGPYDEYFED
jgi:hypothetical protein